MENFIAPIIATVVIMCWCVWYWFRTPTNLRKWYSIPVFLVMGALAVLVWLMAFGWF